MARTSTYSALVIGAGPAGSAAAWALTRQGLTVALVDRHRFPRDKVCGDALIPDALGAVAAMGVGTAVDSESVRLDELRVYAPSGRHVSLQGAFRCVPRARFDHILVDAAVHAGAALVEQATAISPIVEDGRVVGATFMTAAGRLPIHASYTFLATGANATTMSAFGVGAARKPDAAAGRAYYRAPSHVADEFRYLCIAYDRSLCPGYGWIFPGPHNQFNLGVGVFTDRGVDARGLQGLWRRFITEFPPAAAIVSQSEQLSAFRGAPLRTALAAAMPDTPGLLVIGEAAATTYPATGEGIGKAMESGLLAARLVADVVHAGASGETVHRTYASEFRRRFAPRYVAYRVAQAWSSRPRRLNFLVRRANAGAFVRTELESLIAERGDPERLLSLRGIVTALVR